MKRFDIMKEIFRLECEKDDLIPLLYLNEDDDTLIEKLEDINYRIEELDELLEEYLEED